MRGCPARARRMRTEAHANLAADPANPRPAAAGSPSLPASRCRHRWPVHAAAACRCSSYVGRAASMAACSVTGDAACLPAATGVAPWASGRGTCSGDGMHHRPRAALHVRAPGGGLARGSVTVARRQVASCPLWFFANFIKSDRRQARMRARTLLTLTCLSNLQPGEITSMRDGARQRRSPRRRRTKRLLLLGDVRASISPARGREQGSRRVARESPSSTAHIIKPTLAWLQPPASRARALQRAAPRCSGERTRQRAPAGAAALPARNVQPTRWRAACRGANALAPPPPSQTAAGPRTRMRRSTASVFHGRRRPRGATSSRRFATHHMEDVVLASLSCRVWEAVGRGRPVLAASACLRPPAARFANRGSAAPRVRSLFKPRPGVRD